MLHLNNKGADQPAHWRSLVSTFVIGSMVSIIAKLATGKISIFYLLSVSKQVGLSHRCDKNLTLLHLNNKGADQPARQRSLVSTFVIGSLVSIIAKLAIGKISIF